jgi:hypothetical protein
MTHRRWTEDEVLLLRQYHAAGVLAVVAAKRLRRSVYSVREKARLLGLPWKARLQRLAQAGTLADEIAAARREAPTAPLYRPGDRL